jgi:hypothetical protein
MNIVKAFEILASYLRKHLANDKYFIQYKSTIDPEEFEASVPDIFCFTCPSSAIVDSYPAKCPCIVLTLDGRDDTSYDITANLCISSASRSEQEMARPVEGNQNLYNVGEGEGYSTESDEDLIIESILFTDQICNYIYNFTTLDVSEISVTYPDVSLPDFPYCISSVSFKLSVNLEHRGQNPFNDLY